MNGGSWILRTRFGRLDILQHLEPDLGYAQLVGEAIEEVVFGTRVKFCGYRHLVSMKEAAGRDQDLADLAQLRAIRDDDA